MDSDAEALEEKLVSLLGQLQAKAAILERMVYKIKNQHRRGSYFQHLMKILLDVVSVFNMVSSLSQKQQSVKIVQGGLEVFREFYPINEEIIILECVWKSDKFELIERTHKTEIGSHDGALSLGASSVLYQSTESILGDDETIRETADANHSAEKGPVEVKEDKINLMSGLSNDGDNRQLVERCEDGSTVGETPSMKFSEEGCLLTGTSSSSSSDASKLKSGPVKVAFIQVKTPLPSNTTEIHSKETDINSNTKEDASFSLLSSGNVRSSLIDHE